MRRRRQVPRGPSRGPRPPRWACTMAMQPNTTIVPSPPMRTEKNCHGNPLSGGVSSGEKPPCGNTIGGVSTKNRPPGGRPLFLRSRRRARATHRKTTAGRAYQLVSNFSDFQSYSRHAPVHAGGVVRKARGCGGLGIPNLQSKIQNLQSQILPDPLGQFLVENPPSARLVCLPPHAGRMFWTARGIAYSVPGGATGG